jgi:adenine-specific DNA methylase
MVHDKALDSKDRKNIESTEKREVPFWFPKDKLQYPNGKDFKEGTHVKSLDSVPSLFTHRNLIALAILNNEIESIQSKNIRDLMKLTFSSLIAQTTKMMLWSGSSRPSWKVHRYWVPPNNVELNVWDRFENRYFDVLEGKKEAKKTLDNFVAEGQNFDDLIDGKDFVISTQSALKLNDKPASIPPNSIDYVFTDPPYGGSVQYMELSAMWLSWLKGKDNDPRFQLNFDEEVTINDAQGKNFDFYHKMLRASFEEVYRVLKPRKSEFTIP